MEEQEIFKRLEKILRNKNCSQNEIGLDTRITLNSNLYEDLGLDSLDRYELLYLTEGEFDIILEDEKANEFETIRDVCDYIKSHQ